MAKPLAARRFTVDVYHRMGHAGVFHHDDRVELIDGQVVEMSPIGPRHAACVDRRTRRLSEQVGERAVLRVQSPVVLGRHAAPQPDVALLRPPIERYADAHPEPPDILLVIEVADTSSDYDRAVKLALYARYASVHAVRRGHTITALRVPNVTVSTDDVLG